jgi:hypothetical protein
MPHKKQPEKSYERVTWEKVRVKDGVESHTRIWFKCSDLKDVKEIIVSKVKQSAR